MLLIKYLIFTEYLEFRKAFKHAFHDFLAAKKLLKELKIAH